MKNNLFTRFALIIASIVLALLILKRYELKGGIDLAGGTSLLYEVQVPEGFSGDTTQLAARVIDTLKRRVDPLSQKGLTWRVVGGRRIQVQMPLASQATREARKAVRDAEQTLRDSSLDLSDVMVSLQKPAAGRDADFQKYAKDDPQRLELLKKLATAYDKQQSLDRQARDLQKQGKEIPGDLLDGLAQAGKDVTALQQELQKTDVDVDALKVLLNNANSGVAGAREEIQKIVESHPAQRAPIQTLLTADAKLQSVKTNALDDPEDLQRMLKGTGKLDFRISVAPGDAITKDALDSLRDQGPRRAVGNTHWFEIDHTGEDNFLGRSAQYYILGEKNGQHYVLLYDDPQHTLTHDPKTPDWTLRDAHLTQDYNSGQLQVAFAFDPVGARLFGELTDKNVKRQMAILLDDRAISAPTIQTAITGGHGVITLGEVTATRTGEMIRKEANNLVQILNAGALSAALSPEPISVQVITSQMGADNIRAGLRSAVYALIAVIAFMFVYYTITGFFADAAVMINLLITLAVMAFLGASFTLPGIAGVVLTLGMAVDANVLINERIREEIHKGASLWLAVKQGYDKVFWTIFDANLTTSLTSIVLILVGSEEVRGFGITLLIGLIIHMFTALFVTRTFMIAAIRWKVLRAIDDHAVAEYFREIFTLTWMRNGHWPFMRVITVTNIDWIGKRHIFWVVSAIITLAGIVAFIARGPDKYDTEFRGGTQVTFALNHPLHIEEVRKRVYSIGEDNPKLADVKDATVYGVGQTGETGTTFEVQTTVADVENKNDPSKTLRLKQPFLDALAAKFADSMDVIPKVSFAGWPENPAERKSGKDIRELLDAGRVVPLTRPTLDQDFPKVEGMPPRSIRGFEGGVGILVDNLTPPQTAEQLANRIRSAGQGAGTFRNFKLIPVLTADGQVAADRDTRPLKRAVVVAVDPQVLYETGADMWVDKVAAPQWDVVTAAMDTRSPFLGVNSFDAVVADQAKIQALVAIVISLILIVIYVWVRFGGIRYGFGAILSLAHDAIVALAATVLAKYVSETFFGRALLISDFKINLTMIAAYLTVIGYSVNDTIVIFDRIRELRGRTNQPLSAKLVNDAINQCFGRTIWTTFTVFIVVLIMYIWGGPGVHGFSFAMLIGVFTGAYSTLAIASPMLLNVKEKPTSARPKLPPTGGLAESPMPVR